MGDVLSALHWIPYQLLADMKSAWNWSFEDGTCKFNWVPCFTFLAQQSIIHCSTEMDESDLCSALIHDSLYSLLINARQWMGQFMQCFFSSYLYVSAFSFSGVSSGYWTLLSFCSHSSFDPSLNHKSEGSLAFAFVQHPTDVLQPWFKKSHPKFKLCFIYVERQQPEHTD